MKSIFYILSLILSMPSNLQAGNYQDTAIKGVRIQFTYRPSIFPLSWLNAGINAKGEPILPGEISRVKMLMVRALSKYPDTVLQKELRAVYFLRSMSMYNVIYGGTNSRDAVYLTDNGVDMGYTDAFIEQTFHHEFSSILYRNYPALLDTMVWKAANIPNFDYNDPEGGLGAIRKDESSQDLDTALCRIGFLTQYAYSDMENDVNTIAQNLFKPSPGFWNIVNTYPRIKEKVRLLVNFYIKISSGFNQQFFMKMN